ncbi:hypothetical protein BGZ76_003557, partial [Entomortierella beljakovae]
MFMEKLIEANEGAKIIIITPKCSLADVFDECLNPINMLTKYHKFIDDRRVKSKIACDMIIIQAKSLHRLEMKYYGKNVILILGEFSSLCEQMHST